MGDKATARETMEKAGVPIVPGSDGLVESTEDVVRNAHDIGFLVTIKATAGGGGRGIRLANEPREFVKLLQQARSEAGAAFGNDGVYLEKYVRNPRHIEFPVLADKHGNCVHLGEHDCSIRRRNQKLLEEAPSPVLTPKLHKAMGDAAIAAATSISYIGVGTVEFILDESGVFYFMEMTTWHIYEVHGSHSYACFDIMNLASFRLWFSASHPEILSSREGFMPIRHLTRGPLSALILLSVLGRVRNPCSRFIRF